MEPTNFDPNQPVEKLLNEGSENILLQPNNSVTPNVQMPENVSEHQKDPPFFQYLFFISLIIFIIVAGLNIYNLFNLQKSGSSKISNTPTQPISPSIVPTEIIPSSAPLSTSSADQLSVCELNGKEYQVGTKFPAIDGCNICTCTDTLSITCTEKICPTGKIESAELITRAQVPITITPTKSLKPTVDQINQ
jgi:hypothetical protein